MHIGDIGDSSGVKSCDVQLEFRFLGNQCSVGKRKNKNMRGCFDCFGCLKCVLFIELGGGFVQHLQVVAAYSGDKTFSG